MDARTFGATTIARAIIEASDSREAHRANPHRVGAVGRDRRGVRRALLSPIPLDGRAEPRRTGTPALRHSTSSFAAWRRLSTRRFAKTAHRSCRTPGNFARPAPPRRTESDTSSGLRPHDRSLFARIGIAVPEQGTLHLYGIDGEGRIAPMEWPSNWEELREAMTARSKGAGRPPNTPPIRPPSSFRYSPIRCTAVRNWNG